MKGTLISFEGIDGSGKSTQARLLEQYLISNGKSALLLREPGGTVIGERIRSILLDKTHSEMVPLTEVFLYLAARAQITSQRISPALYNGEIVILDRYIDSTTAYQGYARGLGIEDMTGLNLIATAGLVPDITFFVDCDPTLALSRVSGGFDRLESEGLEFMNKVREGFLILSEREKERIYYIDGALDINSVEREIRGIVETFLSSQKS